MRRFNRRCLNHIALLKLPPEETTELASQLRTARPEHDRHVHAPLEQQITPRATCGNAYRKHIVLLRLQGPPRQDRALAKTRRAVSARQRERSVLGEANAKREQRNFDAGGIVGIAQHQVANGQRHAVHRTRRSHAVSQIALAALILNRRQSGVGKYLDHRTILSTLKRIMSPGASMAGFVRAGSKNDMSV